MTIPLLGALFRGPLLFRLDRPGPPEKASPMVPLPFGRLTLVLLPRAVEHLMTTHPLVVILLMAPRLEKAMARPRLPIVTIVEEATLVPPALVPLVVMQIPMLLPEGRARLPEVALPKAHPQALQCLTPGIALTSPNGMVLLTPQLVILPHLVLQLLLAVHPPEPLRIPPLMEGALAPGAMLIPFMIPRTNPAQVVGPVVAEELTALPSRQQFVDRLATLPSRPALFLISLAVAPRQLLVLPSLVMPPVNVLVPVPPRSPVTLPVDPLLHPVADSALLLIFAFYLTLSRALPLR